MWIVANGRQSAIGKSAILNNLPSITIVDEAGIAEHCTDDQGSGVSRGECFGQYKNAVAASIGFGIKEAHHGPRPDLEFGGFQVLPIKTELVLLPIVRKQMQGIDGLSAFILKLQHCPYGNAAVLGIYIRKYFDARYFGLRNPLVLFVALFVVGQPGFAFFGGSIMVDSTYIVVHKCSATEPNE